MAVTACGCPHSVTGGLVPLTPHAPLIIPVAAARGAAMWARQAQAGVWWAAGRRRRRALPGAIAAPRWLLAAWGLAMCMWLAWRRVPHVVLDHGGGGRLADCWAAWPTDEAPGARQPEEPPPPVLLPKVALLFLAPHGPGHEAVWRAFLQAAAGPVPAPEEAAGIGPCEWRTAAAPRRARVLAGRAAHAAQLLAGLAATLPDALKQSLQHGPGFNLTTVGALHPALAPWPPPAYPRPPPMHAAPSPPGSRLLPALKSGWRLAGRGPAAWVHMLWVAAARRHHHDGSGRDPAARWEQPALCQEASSLHDAPGAALCAGQHMFSIYVHTLPGAPAAPPTSLFYGREVARPVDVRHSYAQPALVMAARVLLAEALQDPANMRFVLLSDTSIPLLPPHVVWAQLLSERRSRVDACRDLDVDAHRWRPAMQTPHLRLEEHWRKSSQWWALTRQHAALAVADRHVAEVFKRHCFTNTTPPADIAHQRANHTSSQRLCAWRLWRRWLARPATAAAAAAAAAKAHPGVNASFRQSPMCVADEHYMPTLLATYGLDGQTDCLGVATFTDWQRGSGSHPHMFHSRELTAALAASLRRRHDGAGRVLPGSPPCDIRSAALAAQQVLQGSAADGGRAVHDMPDAEPADGMVAAWIRGQGYTAPLNYSCSLFARKFATLRPPATRPGGTRPAARDARCSACGWPAAADDDEQCHVLRWALSCSFGLGLGWWCAAPRAPGASSV